MDIGPCLRWLEWERRVSVVGVGGEGECERINIPSLAEAHLLHV